MTINPNPNASTEFQQAQMQCQMDITQMQQNMEKVIEAQKAGNTKLADSYLDQINELQESMQNTLKEALSKTDKGTEAYEKLQKALQDMAGGEGAPGIGQAMHALKDLGENVSPISPVIEPIINPIVLPPDDKA